MEMEAEPPLAAKPELPPDAAGAAAPDEEAHARWEGELDGEDGGEEDEATFVRLKDEQEEEEPDDGEIDLRAKQWTHARLLAAGARTQAGRDPLPALLSPEDAQPVAGRPKRRATAPGAGAAAKGAPRGRLLLEAVAADEPKRGESAESHAFLVTLAEFLGPAAEGARLPLFVGREIDLLRLLRVVAALGGAAGVAATKRSWSAVADLVAGRTRAPTKATAHRGAYEALLAAYETHLVALGQYDALVAECAAEFPSAAEEAGPVVPQAPTLVGTAGARPKRATAGALLAAARAAEAAARDVCQACGEPGDGGLLACSFCDLAYHLACVGRTSYPDALRRQLWKCPHCATEDPNNDWCELCNEGGELLLCDTCPRSFHAICLGAAVPAAGARWTCPVCRGEADAGPQEVDVQGFAAQGGGPMDDDDDDSCSAGIVV